jgi:hypothetical protein
VAREIGSDELIRTMEKTLAEVEEAGNRAQHGLEQAQ